MTYPPFLSSRTRDGMLSHPFMNAQMPSRQHHTTVAMSPSSDALGKLALSSGEHGCDSGDACGYACCDCLHVCLNSLSVFLYVIVFLSVIVFVSVTLISCITIHISAHTYILRRSVACASHQEHQRTASALHGGDRTCMRGRVGRVR